MRTGKFSFTNVITDATAYFTRVDYAGIRYFSDILPPDVAATTHYVTVYETQTIPANFAIDRVHFILDVQPKHFQGLGTGATDKSRRPAVLFAAARFHPDASDVQFQDIREETIVKRQEDGTILYPILPTTTDILFGDRPALYPPRLSAGGAADYQCVGI